MLKKKKQNCTVTNIYKSQCWSLRAVKNISKIKILHIRARNNTNKYAQVIVLSDFIGTGRVSIYLLIITLSNILKLEELTDNS